MQLKLLALSLLTALAAADNENLSEIVDDFPECSLPCFAQKADDSGCQTTDFSCVCNKQVEIAARMGGCLSDYCDTLDNFNVGARLGELCERWDDHPSPTEVAAATSALASQVTAASATVKPKNAAGGFEPQVVMAGAAAAAAVLLI
ncbi:hypothetical protein GGS26DRAFT_102973 [Hypomontagnella submonticulosa]|nr:hypothetical protein GGS26DRAFT_102973 [Hypomontagnella submonticulosa]